MLRTEGGRAETVREASAVIQDSGVNGGQQERRLHVVRFCICDVKVVKAGSPSGLDERCQRTGGSEKEQMVFGLSN